MNPPSDDLRAALRQIPVFAGELPSFRPELAPELPDVLFGAWLTAAVSAGVREPHAMTLSTIDRDGRPSSRVLILKRLSDGRWGFATSRASRKGQELDVHPWAALNFYWPKQGRQVRVRGRVLDAGQTEAVTDFLARPAGSRAESWAGNQSQILASERELNASLEHARAAIEIDPDVVPAHWTRYDLLADEVEFWQAEPDRRHTRLRYRLCDERWVRDRLWP